jgi:hypothetical protein
MKTDFWSVSLKRKDIRKVVLKRILNRMCGVDWIHLAQDRDKCWALVNTIIDFGFHKRQGTFLARSATVRFSIKALLYGVS